jgi:hypothetical protein
MDPVPHIFEFCDGRFGRMLRGIVLGAMIAGACVSIAREADRPVPSVKISVRSEVEPRWVGFKKLKPGKSGRIYAIISIKEAPSATGLSVPVKEGRVLTELREALAAHGFTEIVAGQKPDILITVLYGRGFLKNPYLEGVTIDEGSDSVPIANVLLPDHVFRQRQVGYEEKLQAANLEKLFVNVTAWEYPEAPEGKPSKLWSTTMAIDDPVSRDLNAFAIAMLTAGAGYFDEAIKDEEVRIDAAVPEGSVTIGPIKVIEDEDPDGN